MHRIIVLLLLSIHLVSFGIKLDPSGQNKVPPIFYHPGYNLGCRFLTWVHPFPLFKYAAAQKYLKDRFGWQDSDFKKPQYPTDELLHKVHSPEYLNSLENPRAIIACAAGGSTKNVNAVTEYLGRFLDKLLDLLPKCLINYLVLNPMKLATNGTVLATEAALDPENPYKMAINLSGGYHHARGKNATEERGDGFCFYADIPLAIMTVLKKHPKLKVLLVDLDAHQGDGSELTLLDNKENKDRVFVLDFYGQNNYPRYYDSQNIRAKIHYNQPFNVGQSTNTRATYLTQLKKLLPQAIRETKPDLIFYNAGTDPFEKDKIGRMNLTKEDIKERDFFVFQQAKLNNISIVMTTSGGYSQEEIIGESLKNVFENVYDINPT